MEPKGDQKGTNRGSKGNQKSAKVSHGTFKNTPCEQGRKSDELSGFLFDQTSIEIQSKRSSIQRLPKHIDFDAKGCQNGANIDAKTKFNA